MEFAKDELAEAQRQINSTPRKLRKAKKALEAKDHPERYRSQITLAVRRIRALEIASALIAAELERTRKPQGLI